MATDARDPSPGPMTRSRRRTRRTRAATTALAAAAEAVSGRQASAVAALLLGSVCGAAAQTFDMKPLREPVAFPVDSLPTAGPAFLAWLEERSTPIPQAHLPVVREHLYALISADAKTRFVAGDAPLPAESDSALAELFDWGDRLGLTGAALVAARLRGQAEPSSAGVTATPDFAIEFDSLYTVVAKEDGWAIRFPHYFMIGAAQRQETADRIETSMVIVSTLFARDSTSIPGASQATVLILSGRASPPEMTASWLSRLGLLPTDTINVPTPSAVRAYGGRDARSRMNRELVVFAPPDRTILFIYVGVDGTYEANRPHFLDLMNTLRVRRE